MPRKIHKRPSAGLGVASQLLKSFQNIFFGGLGVDEGFDIFFRNAHGQSNTLGAGHVIRHPGQRRHAGIAVFTNANDEGRAVVGRCVLGQSGLNGAKRCNKQSR